MAASCFVDAFLQQEYGSWLEYIWKCTEALQGQKKVLESSHKLTLELRLSIQQKNEMKQPFPMCNV